MYAHYARHCFNKQAINSAPVEWIELYEVNIKSYASLERIVTYVRQLLILTHSCVVHIDLRVQQ